MNKKDNSPEQDQQVAKPLFDVRKTAGRVLWTTIAAGIAVYLLSGIYVVKPEQQALVVRWGKLQPVAVLPGTHYHIPYPVEKVYYLKPSEVKSVVIMNENVVQEPLSEGEIEGEIEDEPEGEMGEKDSGLGVQFLTGDENIVHVALNVQFRIDDPAAYVFECVDPRTLVKCNCESALADTVARTRVDDLLTLGKHVVLERIKRISQKRLDSLNAGVRIIGVNFSSVAPPPEVSDAFKDVASALEDKERIIKEAYGDQTEAIYRAQGQAEKQVNEAMAYRQGKINRAKGETDRFLAVLDEYRQSGKSPSLIMRLYIESIEKVMKDAKKYLIDAPQANSKWPPQTQSHP